MSSERGRQFRRNQKSQKARQWQMSDSKAHKGSHRRRKANLTAQEQLDNAHDAYRALIN